MSEGRTHWEGCWRDRTHHACAVAEIERLQQAIGMAKALVDHARQLADQLQAEMAAEAKKQEGA